jgi:CubicO group peptidase (beta-lactamase class C family)
VKHLLGLSCVLFVPLTAQAQDFDAKAVDALVAEALRTWQVPGVAVAIVQGDKVVYAKGHGVREVGSDQAVTPDTLFAVGSTTKAFTATAVGLLVDEGKMSWDDPVNKYLDYFRLADPLASEQATLRDCLCHRTGLDGHDELWFDVPWGREELLRRIGRVPLDRPFRTTWQYHNFMFLAAGQAVGVAAKSSWEDVVQKRLLTPLGMTGANFSATLASKAANHATPHAKDRTGKVVPVPWRNVDNIGPAGSINAGVADMAKWVRFQLGDGTFEGKRLLSAAQFREMHTPHIPVPRPAEAPDQPMPINFLFYGLGWWIQDYGPHKVVYHTGDIDGFKALVFMVPRAKVGGVILVNLEQTRMIEALLFNLLDQLLGMPKKDWNGFLLALVKKAEAKQKALAEEREKKRHKGTKPSRPLESYPGTYEDPAYGQVVVSLKDGVLQLQWNRYKGPLNHYHYDTFFTDKAPTGAANPNMGDLQVVFTPAADSGVASLRMFDMDFKKVPAKPGQDR